ncbi:MAG: aminotransferase class V-fold PLP-dependent enzyme [Syntrophales bacterium]|jgi:cysteine desulfurase family protein
MTPERQVQGLIYFDNAATTWPKPGRMMEAMAHYNCEVGGSPGRSGHRLSIEAGRIIFETRETLAELFHIDNPLQIVLTKNATEALNIALFGLLQPGDHVITTSMEHNSVMRPLRVLESRGISLSIISCSSQGELSPADIRKAIRINTKMILAVHASNVTGVILPIHEISLIAKENGVIFCVDAAQTSGALPIDVQQYGIDLLAFSGHKSLFGPQGTGGLYIRKGLEKDVRPIMIGGTGSRSEFEIQPDFIPDKYESGTPNTIGIAGLCAGVRFVLAEGVGKIRQKEMNLTSRFVDGLSILPGVKIFGPSEAMERTAVVSFLLANISPSEAAFELDERFGIFCRPGLHCAPSAHRTIGTFPEGTIRFSFGYFNMEDEIDTALKSLRSLAGI